MENNKQSFTPDPEDDARPNASAGDPDDQPVPEEPAFTYPNKFLAQLFIVIGCLIITLVITHSRSRPSVWTRTRIHTAINATEQSTFGYVFNSALFQTIIRNGKNLIRLEEITQKIIEPGRYASGASPQRTSTARVQPVQGRISRGFGAQINPLNGQQVNSTGVEWLTLPGTTVFAIDDGVIVSVSSDHPNAAIGEGGIITIDHGSGLTSKYHDLAGIQVNPGDKVQKGTPLGQTLSSEFFLEARRNGLLIDPLTLIPY